MARIASILLIFLVGISLAGQRGLWIVRNSLVSKTDLYFLQSINQELNLTDIYFQVRALGKEMIPPESQTEKISINDVIRFCKEQHITLHAWINTFYVWNAQPLPADSGHSVLADRQHLMSDATGKPYQYAGIQKAGAEGYFVDPAAGNNLQQIKTLIKKLILRYHIPGIHFDYFRLPPGPLHYSVYLRSRFLSLYFLDPAGLEESAQQYLSVFGSESFRLMQNRYQTFLQNELTERLGELTNFCKELNASCQVSVAVKPDALNAKQEYAQDWPTWLAENDCDFVVVMNYAADKEIFKKNLKMAKSIKQDRRIVMGIGAYHLDAMQAAERIHEIEKAKLGGYSLFSFSTLKNKPGLLSKIAAKVF